MLRLIAIQHGAYLAHEVAEVALYQNMRSGESAQRHDIEARTGIHTVVAESAISCVAEGTGKSLDSLNAMTDGTVNLSRRRQMN